TLESWSGSFSAPRDGPLTHASRAELRAHDPTLLAQKRAALLRRLGTRFFISSGTGDPTARHHALAFSRELRELRLPHRLWLGPGAHNARLWRAQLPAALSYALGPLS